MEITLYHSRNYHVIRSPINRKVVNSRNGDYLCTEIYFFVMAGYSAVFGETLLSKNGPVDVSTLNGKYVGVYFS